MCRWFVGLSDMSYVLVACCVYMAYMLNRKTFNSFYVTLYSTLRVMDTTVRHLFKRFSDLFYILPTAKMKGKGKRD